VFHDLGDGHVGHRLLASPAVWQSLDRRALPRRPQSHDPGIFDGSTIDTGWTKWTTTEFGIGLTVATVAMSLYFWGGNRELE